MRPSTTINTALIALALAGYAGTSALLTPALAKPSVKSLPKSGPGQSKAAATPAQIGAAGQAYARLTQADGMLSNFSSRSPAAAQELKGLLKTGNPDTPTLQAIQTTLRGLMTKVKPARATTVAVEKKYTLLETGKMSYAAYTGLLRNADTSHRAVLAAASAYRQAYGTLRPDTPVANMAVNSRAIANYCETYETEMVQFESAYGKVSGLR